MLCWNQFEKMGINDSLSDNILVQKGVRQGCVISPTLINLYSEAIFDEALFYAEASRLEDLQSLLQKLSHVSEKYELELNNFKTK